MTWQQIFSWLKITVYYRKVKYDTTVKTLEAGTNLQRSTCIQLQLSINEYRNSVQSIPLTVKCNYEIDILVLSFSRKRSLKFKVSAARERKGIGTREREGRRERKGGGGTATSHTLSLLVSSRRPGQPYAIKLYGTFPIKIGHFITWQGFIDGCFPECHRWREGGVPFE